MGRKILRVSSELLLQMLAPNGSFSSTGLPADARVQFAHFDPFELHSVVELIVSSGEFEDDLAVMDTVITRFDPRYCLEHGHTRCEPHNRCACGAVTWDCDGSLVHLEDTQYLTTGRPIVMTDAEWEAFRKLRAEAVVGRPTVTAAQAPWLCKRCNKPSDQVFRTAIDADGAEHTCLCEECYCSVLHQDTFVCAACQLPTEGAYRAVDRLLLCEPCYLAKMEKVR